MLSAPTLSIVIPCYNESESIPALVENLIKIQNDEIEVLLVDNGSTDDTQEVLRNALKFQNNAFINVLRIENNLGYGHGIMTGVRAAKGAIISWTHGDLQTNPDDVVGALTTYINTPGYSKCILKGRRVGRNIFDTFFTFGMGVLASIILRVKLSDINAQPKMFHRSFLKFLDNAPDDFSLDLFFLYAAKTNGLKLIEYPIHFGKRLHGEAKGGGTLAGKWNLIKRTWTYMSELTSKVDN